MLENRRKTVWLGPYYKGMKTHCLPTTLWFQKEDTLYVACGPKIIKLDKITGAILQTYSKGKVSLQYKIIV